MEKKSLTLQLEELYDSKWSELFEHLEGEHVKLQSPFLLGLNKYDDKDSIDESWYTDADLKIMIFGQEPNKWEWPKTEMVRPADFMEQYQAFYNEFYREYDLGTGFMNQKSRFLRDGFNGLSSEISEYLNKNMSNKRATFLWNNISKLAAVGNDGTSGVAVNSLMHEIERKYFHVIPDEINILKPDILIFLTGVTDKYQQYISENFDILGDPIQLNDLPTKDVAKLNIKNIKLTYRTHHPASRCDSSEATWSWYNAIINDIKDNMENLFR